MFESISSGIFTFDSDMRSPSNLIGADEEIKFENLEFLPESSTILDEI